MVIFVNQPFATGLCRGLLPFLFTNQRLSPNERVYIYALEKFRHITDYPLEWHQECFNHFVFDNMPKKPSLPEGKILGFVDVEDICYDAREVGPGEKVYRVFRAHLFEEPLEMQPNEVAKNKDTLRMMSAQMFVPRVPSLRDHGKEFFCPTNPYIFSICMYGYGFRLYLSPLVSKLLLDSKGYLKPITKITLWCGSSTKSFEVDDETRIVYSLENYDEWIRCPRIFSASDKRFAAMVHFACNRIIND